MLSNTTITELNRLNDYSSTKYGPFVDDCHGWGALRSEYLEVEEAAQRRNRDALRAELMDLANVATRWAEELAIKPIGVPFDTNETPEQIEIRQLKQDAHYDHVAAAERIAELEQELAALRSPVDADMWKTPLVLRNQYEDPDDVEIQVRHTDDGLVISMGKDGHDVETGIGWGCGAEFSSADAARASQWLASYAAAHGAAV